jgi:hypothetical protein
MFSSSTRARTVNTRLLLTTTQKGHLSVVEYINKMKSQDEEMIAAGKPLEDDELIEYILAGLDQDYDPIAFVVIARTDPVSLGELYSQLLTFETHRALMGAHEGGASSANAAHRGRGHSGRGGRRDSSSRGGRGRGGPNFNNRRCGFNNSSIDKLPLAKYARRKATL